MSKLFHKLLLASIALALLAPSIFTGNSSAARGSDWKAGRIIDDALFLNPNDMSVQDIQNFLNSKVPVCDTWGTQPASEYGRSDLTHAQYAAGRGWPGPPYACLRNYHEVPKTSPGNYIPDNSYNHGGGAFPGGVSAAQLIYNAAQKHGISNKALLIKLATESAGPLTTDTWPLRKQYTYAMGAHCPDSGPGGSANCDINYSGFSMQISEAAALLRWYIDSMTQSWWQYKKPFQNNNVLWQNSMGSFYNPSGTLTRYDSNRDNVIDTRDAMGCGYNSVYIESKATAALYTYTPYQPNQMALNNMYTTGDTCSAYGNRNFWRTWVDWFGSTSGTPFFSIDGKDGVYLLGANKTYYFAPSYDYLMAYGFGSAFQYRVMQVPSSFTADLTFTGNLPLISRFEGDAIYIVDNGSLHQFTSRATFENYGYTFGQEATLQKWMLPLFHPLPPVENIARVRDNPTIYSIESGKKKQMCTWTAYTTLGSPSYSTRPTVTLPKLFIDTLGDGQPIASQGDVIKNKSNGDQLLIDTSLGRPVDAGVFTEAGLVNCVVPGIAFSQIPSTSSSPIGKTVKNSSGATFVLDKSKKIAFDSSALALSGVNAQNAPMIPDQTLNRITTNNFSRVLRIGSQDAIFETRSQKRFQIASKDDLMGLGYNLNGVISVNQATANMIPASEGSVFKPGRLLRIGNEPAVFMLDGAFGLHVFPSSEVFRAYGNTWSEVVSVNKTAISSYSQQRAVSYYSKDSASTLWLIEGGRKHKISNLLSGASYYNLTTELQITPDPVMQKLTTSTDATTVFRPAGADSVYLIESGKKRLYTSSSAFLKSHTWGDVMSLPPELVSSIPTGNPIY